VSCGVGCRRCSDPVLLWLWCRLVATAPIRPLAWEPPYAAGAALEKAKRQKKKKHTWVNISTKIRARINSSALYLKFWCGQEYWLIIFLISISYDELLCGRGRGEVVKLWHLEVPRLGVESELQLPAYTTATATPDLSHICELHHSSWQCWVLNPLSGARDQTCILVDTSWVHYHWATMGAPELPFTIS